MPGCFTRPFMPVALAALTALTFGCESTTHDPPAAAGPGDAGLGDAALEPVTDATAVEIVEQVAGDDPSLVLPDVLLLTSQADAEAMGVRVPSRSTNSTLLPVSASTAWRTHGCADLMSSGRSTWSGKAARKAST